MNQALLPRHSAITPSSKPKDVPNDGRLIYRVALFVIARVLKAAEAISERGMKLAGTLEVLAVTADSMLNQATISNVEMKGGAQGAIL